MIFPPHRQYFSHFAPISRWKTLVRLLDNARHDILSTFRKGIGNPMSTLRYCLLSFDNVMSVRFFKVLLSSLIPSSVLTSHSLRSITSFLPDTFSTMIRTLSEYRILHTVEVVSRVLPLKSLFPNILLINVDFPALVSPAKKKAKTSLFFILNA